MSIASLFVSVSSFFWPAPVPPPVPAAATPLEEARLLTWTWEASALALTPDDVTLHALIKSLSAEGGVVLDTDGGTYRRYPLAVPVLDGVAVGSAWRVLSEDGERRCAVTGLGIILPAYGDWSALDMTGGAPCVAPLVFADIACDGEGEPMPGSSVAVPIANARAQVAVRSGEAHTTSAPRGPETAALRDPAIQALRVQAREAAAATQQAPLLQEVTTVSYAIGTQSLSVVEGRFYTGEGDSGCGNEDVAVSWGGLLLDGTPVGMRELPDGRISAVLDLDGDGALETLEWVTGDTVLRRATGEIVRAHSTEWCVCGC